MLLEQLVGLGLFGLLVVIVLVIAVFLAPLGIWAALARQAKAMERQAQATQDLAVAVLRLTAGASTSDVPLVTEP